MDMAEKAPLLRLPEDGPAAELERPADIVEKRRREQQVGAEPRVELRRLAAERRHADGVLEQPAGVRVVVLEGRREVTQRAAGEHSLDRLPQARVRDLGRQELEEAFELVRVAPEGWRHRLRVDVGGGLDRANGELETIAEALDTAEDAHGVALAEAAVEELDVLPHARVDAAARIDELEREVRSAGLRPQALLPGDPEHAFDHPVLGELD